MNALPAYHYYNTGCRISHQFQANCSIQFTKCSKRTQLMRGVNKFLKVITFTIGSDLIVMNNPQITAAYDEYIKCGTELTLRNDLFRIYKI